MAVTRLRRDSSRGTHRRVGCVGRGASTRVERREEEAKALVPYAHGGAHARAASSSIHWGDGIAPATPGPGCRPARQLACLPASAWCEATARGPASRILGKKLFYRQSLFLHRSGFASMPTTLTCLSPSSSTCLRYPLLSTKK